ncbi:MAG: ABC-F family ATP-binding cassette domain-containing protein [Acidobacteriota bacterium]|nr:ABC-F family ATP-binding cassette domain-containing protein [Acidobacteriota bacterium]
MLFRLTDASKSYSGHEVLKGVSFQLNPAEKVGLVGRNGAGKTTVFRLISGDETPDSGSVEKVNRLRIGILEQHVAFEEDESVHTSALSAFKTLHDIEAEMRRLEVEMEGDHSAATLDRYAELQTRFEREGGFEYVARAEAVLLGLKFEKDTWGQKTSTLSGGQQNRLGMVRLLLSNSDVLLLDEPTNHLDVATVEWLEDYLDSYDGAYMIISHDRYFLDKTCSRIIEIENGMAYSYKGNYSKYSVDSQIRKEQLRREFENQKAFIQKTEAFIRKNLAGQKTKQAKSRRNMLERMDRITDIGANHKEGDFELGGVERTGAVVLSVKDLSIGYPGTVLAENVDFSLHRGDSMGIIGGNGTGKSTLLKTVLGEIRELAGSLQWGTKVKTGYYSQQLEGLTPNNDLISELRTVAPSAEAGELRSFLAGFLFFGEDVFKRVADLSGGEKGRLALAKLIFSQANVLILDEPTNHLDIPSREALEIALQKFEGTIIAVSHDRYFLDRIATQIFAFEPGPSFDVYNGNYSEYHDWKDGQSDNRAAESSKPAEIASAVPIRKEVDLSKNELNKIRKRIAEIESLIPQYEDAHGQLASKLSDPETTGDRNGFERITRQYNETEESIKRLYDEWDQLTAKIS